MSSEKDIARLEKSLSEKREQLKRLQEDIRRTEEELRNLRRGTPIRTVDEHGVITVHRAVSVKNGRDANRREKFNKGDQSGRGGREQQPRPREERPQRRGKSPRAVPATDPVAEDDGEDIFDRFQKAPETVVEAKEAEKKPEETRKQGGGQRQKQRGNREKRNRGQKKEEKQEEKGPSAEEGADAELSAPLDLDDDGNMDWADESDRLDIPEVHVKIGTSSGEQVLVVGPDDDSTKKAEEFCDKYGIPKEYLQVIVDEVNSARSAGPAK